MRIQPSPAVSGVLLALLIIPKAAPAQSVTTHEGLSLQSTLARLVQPAAPAPVGDAIALATALEVNTAPLGSLSGGFVFKPDPVTGLLVRTTTTFGPSFAERAITTGAGKVNVGASLAVATYDRLGDFSLSRMQVSSLNGPTSAITRTGNASLVLSSQTLVLMGTIGATDNLDISVAVPMIKVEVDGLSWVERADGVVATRATGAGIASGLGDIALTAKYRVARFGEEQPDPGGLAVLLTARLPTGDRDNLRGLGMNRVLGLVIFSMGRGRFRPHANGGFEWWEKGLAAGTGQAANARVEARHLVQYAAGAEFEAAPRFTLIADLVGRHVLGGGRIDMLTCQLPPANEFGVASFEAAGATDRGIRKLMLVPGIKWNLKGTFVVSLNARIPVSDNSLYDRFTPVLGLEWTF